MNNGTPANIVPMTPFLGNGPGMPVVLYLRKSNKTKSRGGRDESVSIEQQREELYAYCKKREWLIVGEYIDDGKSASKNDIKRVEFARLLVDVGSAEFRAVVVWDLSRLTRKDSVDAAKAAAIFKNAGILVESLRDNEIDLNTEMGRHLWNLHCEGNHAFAKKVSGGTIRGRKDSLARGNFPGSQIPYGYRRQYWDGDQLKADLHRREPGGKARHWATQVAIDPTEGPIATRIFKDFTSRDISRRGLAIELQREGVPTFSGKDWTPAHVKTILRCPIYLGNYVIGYSDQWERKAYEAHERFETQVKENACPPLIDLATWLKAQEKLKATKESGKRTHAGKSSPLSGIVFCGHCGKAMVKNTRKGVTRFTCSTASKNSATATCKQWAVQESDILPIMVKKLTQRVDFEILEQMQAQPPEGHAGQLAALDKQEAELSTDVTKIAKNLARCDASVYDDIQTVLMERKSELEKVRNTAHLLRTSADKIEFHRTVDWWRANKKRLVTLEYVDIDDCVDPETGDTYTARCTTKGMEPDAFRELLKRLNAKLTLHFVSRQMGKNSKRQYYAVEWGQMTAEISDIDAVHSLRGSTPANARAPTAPPCATRSQKPAKSSKKDLVTAPPMPAWTANNSAPIANFPTPACCS